MKLNVFWILSILWIGIIFNFSLKPAAISREQSGEVLASFNIIGEDEIQDTGNGFVMRAQHILRKWAHFIEYFILGCLVLLAFTYGKKTKWLVLLTAFFLCVLVGTMDEIIQLFVPGRGAMVKDVFLDAEGSLAGMIITGMIVFIIQHVGRVKHGKDRPDKNSAGDPGTHHYLGISQRVDKGT